jgi:hypothetical protein
VEVGDAGENLGIKVIFFVVGHATDSIFTTTIWDNLATSSRGCVFGIALRKG